MPIGSKHRRKVLILTSHGIRTNAKWQELLEDIVEEEVATRAAAFDAAAEEPGKEPPPEVTFLHNDYKFFSIFSFINPFRRRAETRRFEERLRRYVESSEYDEIHLVGHSFGTHIIGHSLLALGDELKNKVGTVILAGSVLPGLFPWDNLFRTSIRRLVNECGDKDFILVLNAILPLGSGLAGRRGFAGITGDHFRNRFFTFGHSGYFQKRDPDGADETWFMRKYWVPLLLGDRMTPYIDERPDASAHLFRGWLVDQSEGLKWLVPVGLAGAIFFVFLYFALVWRTNFNLETLDLAGTVIADVERFQLDGLQEKIVARQAAIEQQAESAVAKIEGFVRDEAARSYFPDQWERARVAAAFAQRPTIKLVDATPWDVRFRGSNFVSLRLPNRANDAGEADAGPSEQMFDLRTGKPAQSPMWDWSGEYVAASLSFAAPTDSAQGFVPLNRYNLQGSIENDYAVSLTAGDLKLWSLEDDGEVAAWRADLWGKERLFSANPCGRQGDVLALTELGKAWVLRKDGEAAMLPAPDQLAMVVGNADCSAFAGATSEQKLVLWPTTTSYRADLPAHFIQTMEFSASDGRVVLVNPSLREGAADNHAELLSVDNADPPAWVGATEAVFSPDGNLIAGKSEDECSIFRRAGNAGPVFEFFRKFTCPTTNPFGITLPGQVRFTNDGTKLLTARQHRGSFGVSHLELTDLLNGAADWLVRASRYDIVSSDTTPDATAIVTTSGDSASEGYGADYGFYVWSPYSSEAVFLKRADAAALQAWVTPDGSKALVVWQRYDAKAEQVYQELELVRLDPDGAVELNLPAAVARGQAQWASSADRVGSMERSCEITSDEEKWFTRPLSGIQARALRAGCGHQWALLIGGNLAGRPVQLRLSSENSDWTARYRDLATRAEGGLAFADGTPLGDDITDFDADPTGRRIFLAHADGSITRVSFDPQIALSRLRPPSPGPAKQALAWNVERKRLIIERLDPEQARASHKVEFLDDGGRLVRSFELAASPGQGTLGGIFDANDHYWAIVTVNAVEPQQPGAEGQEIESAAMPERLLQSVEAGESLPYGCDGSPYAGQSLAFEGLPELRVSRNGRFVGAGNLAPTIGAAQPNTEMRIFDLKDRKCLGVFEHGDEIYDFAVNSDGKLLITRGLNETFIWHIPTHTIVRTFFGPTAVVNDEYGLRLVSRANADRPAIWPIPPDVDAWLKRSGG